MTRAMFVIRESQEIKKEHKEKELETGQGSTTLRL